MWERKIVTSAEMISAVKKLYLYKRNSIQKCKPKVCFPTTLLPTLRNSEVSPSKDFNLNTLFKK